MKDLKNFLEDCSRQYYNTGESPISDEVFDRLAETIGYNTLGYDPVGKTAKHMYPLYSLDKFYPEDGGKNPLSEYEEKDKCRTPKIDGAAISLLYIDGELLQALTRGNGIEGQIITDKIVSTSTSLGIPTKINMKGIVQITGEIAAPLHIENARNYAAGALNLKDINEFKTRAIVFIAYGVYPNPTENYETDLKVLERAKFTTVLTKCLESIYPLDGIVVRLCNNTEFSNLGYTAKHPRGAFAIKERAEAVETTILDVVWQVGKSGKVTPVAILDPIMIEDANISRATLNNKAFIESLGIEIGDRVLIIRAGSIIPCVVGKADQ